MLVLNKQEAAARVVQYSLSIGFNYCIFDPQAASRFGDFFVLHGAKKSLGLADNVRTSGLLPASFLHDSHPATTEASSADLYSTKI